MYPPSEIPMPDARPTSDPEFPYRSRSTGSNPDIFCRQQATPEQTREAIAAYYGCVTFVDAGIGMILDQLEEQGLADKTIVVFFADHGFHLGDHGMWSKYSLLEPTKRVPLIVRVPGANGNGQACQRIVELVDLIPTLNELVVLNAPGNLEGTSFATLLDAPGQPWKKAAFTDDNNDRARSVRTERYNYIEWKKPSPVAAALFDLEKDPWETTNLADDPQHAEVRKEMAELLKAGWKAALPR
jgi:arylsulfatase A-like enzyme